MPPGATIVPIIAASDKTPVTRQTGGLELHPLFLTVGNIDSDIRMKATSHAWRCIAFMPIAKFETHKDYQTLLQSRIWHKCVDVVFSNAKQAANVGTFMADPFGNMRYCFTPLVAWIADLPEQQLISCTSKNASPITLATIKQFGDAVRQPARMASHTLSQIHAISRSVNPWHLDHFQKMCKEAFLSGVHLPFWRDWLHSKVSTLLTPEVLHALHKFFFDHILVWCKEVIGGDELDARYKVLHKRLGIRHFSSGVSHVKHMTGCEHRDIQRTIVAVIAGAAPTEMVQAIRALVDFIYQAQCRVHTESLIQRMEASLAEFHATKDAVLTAGARRGKNTIKEDFNIPKLELFLSFAKSIRRSGPPIQYTANVTERLLITHAKLPFTRTNRQKDFAQQIVRLLDHEERMRLMDLYLLLRKHEKPLINAIGDKESVCLLTDPTMVWIARVAPGEQRRFDSPHPIRNHFTKGLVSEHAALSVTVSPDCSQLNLAEIGQLYSLPEFAIKIQEYIAWCIDGGDICSVL